MNTSKSDKQEQIERGKRIKNIRENELHLNKSQLAKMIGVSSQFLGLVEEGKGNYDNINQVEDFIQNIIAQTPNSPLFHYYTTFCKLFPFLFQAFLVLILLAYMKILRIPFFLQFYYEYQFFVQLTFSDIKLLLIKE